MTLNIDLFKYYSETLERENEMIQLRKAKETHKVFEKRKILLEVEISEDEYQDFIKKDFERCSKSFYLALSR